MLKLKEGRPVPSGFRTATSWRRPRSWPTSGGVTTARSDGEAETRDAFFRRPVLSRLADRMVGCQSRPFPIAAGVYSTKSSPVAQLVGRSTLRVHQTPSGSHDPTTAVERRGSSREAVERRS
jgi:hypothetical protein